MRTFGRTSAALISLLLLLVSTASVVLAQQASDVELDSPVRGISIQPTQDRVDLDVVFYNRTDGPIDVQLSLEDVPGGWNVGIWNTNFAYRITEYIVQSTAANPDRLQQGRLRIVPPSDVEAGTYSFNLRVLSQDGNFEYDSATYTIRVAEREQDAGGEITVRSERPVLQGVPGETLGFEISVRNGTAEDVTVNLAADPPAGWDVTFREPFGQQRVIGAVSVQDGFSERVRVDVEPPRDIDLGEYEIPVMVNSAAGNAETTLTATLAGRGELRATTTDSRLSLEARAGGEGEKTLRLTNTGTDTLRDVRLVADAPSNWVIDFGIQDNLVTELPAGNQIEIDVTISPPAESIPGDYVITLRSNTAESNANLDLRVTVTQSTIWGWLGVALVVLVVGGMIGLFLKLGR
ncbi:MAG: NEW3 domain-containing protein, partial [Dehalococcoidia bacterium]